MEDRTAALQGSDTPVRILVSNYDSNSEVSSIDYSWEVDGLSGEGSYSFPTPIRNSRGAVGVAIVDITAPASRGSFPMTLTITKVNGVENVCPKKTGSTTLISSLVLPRKRPLVDEYTGLWCPQCPLGYVTVETMAEKYAGDFVCAVWHYNDAMSCKVAFPTKVSTYPNSAVDRMSLRAVNLLEEDWLSQSTYFTPVDVAVDLRYTDDSQRNIEATANLTWIENNNESHYDVGFILVANGLSNPSWAQKNNYRGSSALHGKYAELFTQGATLVYGLTFNDVVMESMDAGEAEGSSISNIRAYTTYKVSQKFDVQRRNSEGSLLVSDGSKLRVIAYVVDPESGYVVNCNVSGAPVASDSGVKGVEESVDVITRTYYDLSGLQVSSESKGILIERIEYSNGKFSTSKRFNP
ncbi:MAG: hypothetical protein NC097_07715 [Clostridium sp.]|nr:hypothetical protein [Prevotella sp.]MCM1429665.1 hypothetical protein [Clostridium sp.]MCM1474667.1 hypothetical protein [Muribaculaceae bacterium]